MSDLRDEVHQMIEDGASDAEIVEATGALPSSLPGYKASLTRRKKAEELGETGDESATSTGGVRLVERNLQRAIAKDLGKIEDGLELLGEEVPVETGRMDILAESRDETLVVIELKADEANEGALAQVMSYMAALTVERDRTVRGYLIAESFSDRVKWAAKRDPDLRLLRYLLNPTFETVE